MYNVCNVVLECYFVHVTKPLISKKISQRNHEILTVNSISGNLSPVK